MTTVTIYKPENSDYRRNYGYHAWAATDQIENNLYELSKTNPALFILNGRFSQVEQVDCELNTIDAEPILNEAYDAIRLYYREKTKTLSSKTSVWQGNYWGIDVGDLFKIEERNELYIVESFGFRLLGEK